MAGGRCAAKMRSGQRGVRDGPGTGRKAGPGAMRADGAPSGAISVLKCRAGLRRLRGNLEEHRAVAALDVLPACRLGHHQDAAAFKVGAHDANVLDRIHHRHSVYPRPLNVRRTRWDIGLCRGGV